MPIYAFRCPDCGMEFEVSRKMTEATKEANCPMDGAVGTRIFSALTTLASGRGESSAPKPADPAPKPAANPWSHFGHSHGAGIGGHAHGAPRRPPPAAG